MRRQEKPLRLLVVARHAPWPLEHGGRLRLFHFVQQLAGSTMITLVTPEAEPAGHRLPRSVRWIHVPEAPPHNPPPEATWTAHRLHAHFGTSRALRGWLREHARPDHFDVALCSGAATGLCAGDIDVPVVWDAVDEPVLRTLREARLHHGGIRRLLRPALVQAALVRFVARRAAATVFTAKADARSARWWAGTRARIVRISNGVDCEYFAPPDREPDPHRLLFFGALDFPPNVDGIVRFVRRIWPGIHRALPGARLEIVGRNPADAVCSLAAVPGVRFVGPVPDVRPHLAAASVVVVPVGSGGGVKNKILEAAAMARAMVIEPVAAGDLTARPGVEVLYAHSPGRWVRHVRRLLSDPCEAGRIGRAARAWVQRSHAWPEVSGRLTQLLSACAAAPPARRATAVTGADAGATAALERVQFLPEEVACR